VIVCDLFEWMQISIKVFYHLFTYVLAMEIQLLRREGWDSINRFNSTVVYEANDGNDYSYLYKFSGRLSGQFIIYLFRLSSRLILVGYC
jgi:hypothetical protein